MSLPIITTIRDRGHFAELLLSNPGTFIMKLGAEWCGPCKKIKHVVDGFFATSPPNVICAEIDVDESFDLYAQLKSKKMVNGIPVILCYKKGNVSFIPDDSITGIDATELNNFFKRCGDHLANVEQKTDLVFESK